MPLLCKTRIFCDWGKSLESHQFYPPKHFKSKVLKKFAKYFSRLEVSLARESRAEPRKSLCTPRDWTFHSRTSRQNRPASLQLRHATCMTRDWVAKTGQRCFLKFSIFVKTKYFPKTPKTLKNIFLFESTKIEHLKTHFIKYNHTNEYGIHWT